MIRAIGPWVLIKVKPSATRTKSGLYLPEGNLDERLGHSSGTVLSVGQGKVGKKGRVPIGVEVGQEVLFRGFLKEANRPSYGEPDVCLIHQDDIIGVLDAAGT